VRPVRGGPGSADGVDSRLVADPQPPRHSRSNMQGARGHLDRPGEQERCQVRLQSSQDASVQGQAFWVERMRALDGSEGAEGSVPAVEELLEEGAAPLVGEVRASQGSETREALQVAAESRQRAGRTLRLLLGAATDAEALNRVVRAVAHDEV
jgi:hypothetical protein